LSTLHLTVNAETPLSSTQIRQALTDFSPRRAEFFSNVETGYLQSSILGATSAEVTEGSHVLGGIWERNRYDWSEPDVVRAETVDSNTWAVGSKWKYRFTDRPGGGTDIELETLRIPKNARGRLVVLLLRLMGRRHFARELQTTLKQIAARPAGT
jgi:hypothetical protein